MGHDIAPAGTGHIARHQGRLAGNMLDHMARHEPRGDVITIARREADIEREGLVLIEFSDRIGACVTGRKNHHA